MLKFLRENIYLVVFVALLGLTIWPLFMPGYFSHHDDLHVMRIFEMRKCFTDLQIPCRWVPDMGYGFGYPLFNYYNPFVYYLGAILSFVFGFVWSAKFLFLIALVLGPAGIYLLGKELWGKFGGLTSSILFIFLPYRALDSFVRGALAELFAISIIPFLLLFILHLIKLGRKRDFVLVAITFAGFLLTHNVSVILWSPFIVIWSLYWLFQTKFKNLLIFFVALVVGFGLSAFFIIPAFAEKDLVMSETLTVGDLDYHAHFATVRQLFADREWEYGASRLGPNDDLSMQIGWMHWGVVVATLGFALLLAGKIYKAKKPLGLVLLLIISFAIAVFMTHNKSTFIWDFVGILKYIQFPWRYLGVAGFMASLLGGFLIEEFGVYRKYLFLMIVFGAVALNFSYFRPKDFYLDINDVKKLNGDEFRLQQRGAIFDYLPKTAVDPKDFAFTLPLIKEGDATIKNFVNSSKSWELDIDVIKDSKVELPVFYFPGWASEGYELFPNKYGRIELNLPQGSHSVVGSFNNTSVRNIANLISVLSLLFLVLGVKYAKNRKIFK